MSIFDKAPAGPGGLFGQQSGTSGLFGGSAEPEDDDPDVEGEGIEGRATRVLSEAEQAFRERAQREADRFELATDSEYWAALCFQSRRQKEQFLQALRDRLGLRDDGDKYLDGWEVAKAMGITLDREDVPYNTSAKQDRRWLELTR